jgi:hypothetical protein
MALTTMREILSGGNLTRAIRGAQLSYAGGPRGREGGAESPKDGLGQTGAQPNDQSSPGRVQIQGSDASRNVEPNLALHRYWL